MKEEKLYRVVRERITPFRLLYIGENETTTLKVDMEYLEEVTPPLTTNSLEELEKMVKERWLSEGGDDITILQKRYLEHVWLDFLKPHLSALLQQKDEALKQQAQLLIDGTIKYEDKLEEKDEQLTICQKMQKATMEQVTQLESQLNKQENI